MRKLKKFSFILLFLSVAVVFTSCSKDDNPTESSDNDLVGVWVLSKVILTSMGNMELTPDQIGVNVTFELRSDKTFKATTTDSTGTDVSTGTWSAANSKVTLKSSDGQTQEMPYTKSGDQLTVETVIDMETYGTVPVKLVLNRQK